MPRPTELDLSVPNERWRDVVMPGANAPFGLTRLDSPEDEFVVHGRFPAGFERIVPGGYVVAEEFLVLEGALFIEGAQYRRGDLTYIPARFLRTDMYSPAGCTVLAWFGGAAIFHKELDLPDPSTTGIRTISVLDANPGQLMDAEQASWDVLTPSTEVTTATGDLVDAGLGRWRRVSGTVVPTGPDLLRTRY